MHRLTPAQREFINWVKLVTGPNSGASRHKSENDRPRQTATVLLREGYLQASKPDKNGYQRLTLTAKGQTAA